MIPISNPVQGGVHGIFQALRSASGKSTERPAFYETSDPALQTEKPKSGLLTKLLMLGGGLLLVKLFNFLRQKIQLPNFLNQFIQPLADMLQNPQKGLDLQA